MTIRKQHLETGQVITGETGRQFRQRYNEHSEGNASDLRIQKGESYEEHKQRVLSDEPEEEVEEEAEEKEVTEAEEEEDEVEPLAYPEESWTHDEIDDFMDEHYPDFDYDKTTKKADKLEEIEEAFE